MGLALPFPHSYTGMFWAKTTSGNGLYFLSLERDLKIEFDSKGEVAFNYNAKPCLVDENRLG
jgi:hypothetical protein